ncbi:MAG: kelch repeat-containing protein, partial [Gemmatimonadales bacterium]
PTPRSRLATAVVNGQIYAIGGYNGDGPEIAVERYDPTLDTWTRRFPLLRPLQDHTAAAVNGLVYVMGGSGYWDSVASVYVYDPANGR